MVLGVGLEAFCSAEAVAQQASTAAERMFEASFESKKAYADPFNDVDVDVIFTQGGRSWRVPTFWRGGQRWTVRFAPPKSGTYRYHLESTDRGNFDLNGHEGRVVITAYTGANALLGHGVLKVSPNRRYFEHADGTPFFWLGETWFSGLSSRLSWEGFQKLTADRKAKGFTGVSKLEQHWRYLIARYGAYPVFWIAGGEVYDPPPQERKPGLPYGATTYDLSVPGWIDVVRYIRATDPYHHPLTAEEIDPPYDTPLQDESLKDFELFQAGHRGWPSISTAIAPTIGDWVLILEALK